VSRTSVVEHYGLKQLMYGVLLPGPDIGRRAIAEMRAPRAGFECGIHTWDHVYWQDNVRSATPLDAREMQKSHARFDDIFGAPPVTHGAAGWQMNDAAFEQIDAWGMHYASDGRGHSPYLPTVGGTLSHVQMPTTLPTLDEVLGIDGVGHAQRRRASAEAHRDQSARSGVHAACGTRRPETRAGVRATARRLARTGPHVCDDGRLPRNAGPRLAAIVPCRRGCQIPAALAN
jgi:peptidoglycan/xylan/chitin deacetylase (PgdA/CDA1 family)